MHLLHKIRKAIIKKTIKRILGKLKERHDARIAASNAPSKVLAPVAGTVIEMADVPDDIFGQNDIGAGCGIWPDSGQLTSPVSGVIPTTEVGQHTAIIVSDDGVQLLVHVGSSENDAGEKSAKLLVNADQQVKAGDPLMSFTLRADTDKPHDQFVIIAILNSADYAETKLLEKGAVTSGQEMLEVVPKAAKETHA